MIALGEWKNPGLGLLVPETACDSALCSGGKWQWGPYLSRILSRAWLLDTHICYSGEIVICAFEHISLELSGGFEGREINAEVVST